MGPNPAILLSRRCRFRDGLEEKVRIALAWVVCALAGFIVVRMLPRVYLAEAVILIDSQKIPEKFVSATVASDLEERIAADSPDTPERPRAQEDHRRIRPLPGGEKNALRGRNPGHDAEENRHHDGGGRQSNRETSRRFPHWLPGPGPDAGDAGSQPPDGSLLEQNLKTREEQAAGTSEFLDTQLREAKKRLDLLEQAVSAYKLQHNGELPEQESLVAGHAFQASDRTRSKPRRDQPRPADRRSFSKATLTPRKRAWPPRAARGSRRNTRPGTGPVPADPAQPTGERNPRCFRSSSRCFAHAYNDTIRTSSGDARGH